MMNAIQFLGLPVVGARHRVEARQPIDRHLAADTFSLRFAGSHGVSKPGMSGLFTPKSIAVIGATPNPGIGRTLMNNLAGGFQGKVYPVNPRYEGVLLEWKDAANVQPFVKSIDQLPQDGIDMALIATPARFVPQAVEQLGQKGVKSVVVISAGFNEEGNHALANELNAVVKKYGISMLGPNCMGVMNMSPAVRMNATFKKAEIPAGRGAIMSQSGGVGGDLMNQAENNYFGFHQMATIGNQNDVNSTHLLEHWGQDPDIAYITGYIEGIPDPARFREVAARVTRQKPVFLLKVGRSDLAAKAAASHTGALAGSDTAVDALFAQTGVQRIKSVGEMFTIAKAWEKSPPLTGNKIAVVSNSGGLGIMATDVIQAPGSNLAMAELSESTRDTLKAVLPAGAGTRNPVDILSQTAADNPQAFKQALLAIGADPGVSAIVVGQADSERLQPETIIRILGEVQQACGKPVMGVLPVSEPELKDVLKKLDEAGVAYPAIYRAIDDPLTGLKSMESHRRWLSRPALAPVRFNDVKPAVVGSIIAQAQAEGRTLLTTAESMEVLRAYGIPTARYALVQSKRKAVAAARQMGYPVVIKFVSKTITHKSDVGGVKVNIRSAGELQKAYDAMLANLKAKTGFTVFQPGEGIMVEQMVSSDREPLIGFKEDPQYGKMIGFGEGGIYVNYRKDATFRLLPLSRQDVKDMMNSVRFIEVLKADRGKGPADTALLEDVILRYAQLAEDFPQLAESDMNPFFALPQGPDGSPGGIAVDARFTLK